MRTKDEAYSALVGVAAMGTDPAGGTQPCAASAETLPAARLQQVRAWIANGAPND